jgi:hypothetical protein
LKVRFLHGPPHFKKGRKIRPFFLVGRDDTFTSLTTARQRTD